MSSFFQISLLLFVAWNIGFLTSDILLILHAGCLTFHAANHTKQTTNPTKAQLATSNNTEKV